MKWSLTITGDESEIRDLERLTKMLRESMPTQELESKYSPLHDFLVQQRENGETHLEFTVDEIQQIIQTDLPPSAQKHDSFWRDRQRNIGAHIVKAGWRIAAIERSPEDERVAKIRLRRHCHSNRHHTEKTPEKE